MIKNKLKAKDFLVSSRKKQTWSGKKSEIVFDDFEFSDYGNDSDDDQGTSEDSEGNQSQEEFSTPMNLKNVALLPSFTPNLAKQSNPKRGASSPQDSENPKKQRNKKSLPVKNLK